MVDLAWDVFSGVCTMQDFPREGAKCSKEGPIVSSSLNIEKIRENGKGGVALTIFSKFRNKIPKEGTMAPSLNTIKDGFFRGELSGD